MQRAEDSSWAEAERLTDSSCTQRWVASAGFTLLAFACLQPAWCSCQPLIDEYHHLKCKRKRLCEGRHDEVPPAGALRDTLSASSSLSLFLTPPLLFSPPLPPVHLFLLCFFFHSVHPGTSLAVCSSSLFLPLLSSSTTLTSLYCPHLFHLRFSSFIHACDWLFFVSPWLWMSLWTSPLLPACLLFTIHAVSDHMKRQNSYGSAGPTHPDAGGCVPADRQRRISSAVFCNVISLNLPPC